MGEWRNEINSSDFEIYKKVTENLMRQQIDINQMCKNKCNFHCEAVIEEIFIQLFYCWIISTGILLRQSLTFLFTCDSTMSSALIFFSVFHCNLKEQRSH